MSGERSEFLRHVHSFRAFAIVAIVATHAYYDLHWFEDNHLAGKITVSIVQNGTVPFVFIAGFLFQHLLGRFRYRTYLSSKLRFVVLPYVVVSLPYIAIQKVRHFGIFADWYPRRFDNDVAHVALALLSGRQMPIPLWFVPMICVYYLAAPLFALFDRHPRMYLSLPFLCLLASFAHRPQTQTMLYHSLVYFLPVYLAGMFTSRFRGPVLDLVRRFRWPLIAVAGACVVIEVMLRERTGAIESRTMFSTERGVFDLNLTMKLLGSVVLLDALRSAGPLLHRILRKPADLTFGIFFLHYYFIYFAHDLRVAAGGGPWSGRVLNLALYTAALTALSMAVVWLIQRIFGKRSRYLVGC